MVKKVYVILFVVFLFLGIGSIMYYYMFNTPSSDEDGYICDADVANENDKQYIASLMEKSFPNFTNRAVSVRNVYFKPGDTVYYSYTTPYPELIELAESILQTYFFPFVNLNYVRVDEHDSRVDKTYVFDKDDGGMKRSGSCEGIGTQKSRIFVVATPNAKKFQGTLIHESLHSLGYKHEHINPQNNPIRWFEDKVYAFYSEQGWPKKAIDDQIIKKLNPEDVIATDYDPYSIMNYKTNPELYYGTTIHRGDQMSDGDKKLLVTLYGQPQAKYKK